MMKRANSQRLMALWLAAAVMLVLCPVLGVSAQATKEEGISNDRPRLNVVDAWGQTMEEEGISNDHARYKELREDIEVMARLIDQRMSEEFKGDYRAESFFSKGCEGFYVPEVGAVFVLRVKFPVFLQEPQEEEEAEPGEMDPWDREKWRLRLGTEERGSRGRRGTSGPVNVAPNESTAGFMFSERLANNVTIVVQSEEHQKRIKDLKQELISVLGRFGRRISGLAGHERITVAVLGEGGHDHLAQTLNYYTVVRGRNTKGDRRTQYVEPRRIATLVSGAGDIRTTLVISARVSDLPEQPPEETLEDAPWVQILAY